MGKIREILKTLLFTVVIVAAVYFAADMFLPRLSGGTDAEPPETAAVSESMPESAAAPEPVPETAAASEPASEAAASQPAHETAAAPEPVPATAAPASAPESMDADGAAELLTASGYARSCLGPEDAGLYDELYAAITGFSQDVSLSVTEPDRIELVFKCVLADHPEIFYVDGYTLTTRTLGEEVQSLSFQAEYTFTEQQTQERAARVEEAADAVLSSVTEEMDDYEKLKLFYDYVAGHTEYSLYAPENQTICSVFLYGQSVCQGYAKAFQYLCKRAGIPAVLVTGTVSGGQPHAWTLVRCDGEWYHADPAWGDVSYQMDGGEEAGPKEQVDYDYFLVTTAQISLTHTADSTFPLPECISMKDNYYVRENLYFTEADPEQVQAAFEAARREGRPSVTFKCADITVYEALYERLLTQQEVFQYLQGEAVSYAVSKEQLTLTFFL